MAALEQKENEVGSIFLDPGRLGTSLCPIAPLTPPRSCSPCWGLVDREQHWLVNCALFQWCAFWKAGMFWKRSLVIIYGSCFRPVYYKYLIIFYNGSSTPWLPLVAPGLHLLATPHLISFWMGSLENHANHFTNEHLPAAGSSTAPSNGYFQQLGIPPLSYFWRSPGISCGETHPLFLLGPFISSLVFTIKSLYLWLYKGDDLHHHSPSPPPPGPVQQLACSWWNLPVVFAVCSTSGSIHCPWKNISAYFIVLILPYLLLLFCYCCLNCIYSEYKFECCLSLAVLFILKLF
jgi:hypothetical protein